MNILKRLMMKLTGVKSVLSDLDEIKMALGRLECLAQENGGPVNKREFKVYSQWGEDGIIQNIINRLPDIPQTFVEFGVENFTESNTRFLLKNNGWTGLVIDGSQSNVKYIKNDPIYWKTHLTAVAEFITAENINKLIRDAGIEGDIGLLGEPITHKLNCSLIKFFMPKKSVCNQMDSVIYL